MTEESEKRNFGLEFEEEVRSFLRDKFQFVGVKGGADFHIAPDGEKNQIDAAGRFGDTLFVFECKAAGKRVKKSLRQDILAGFKRSQMAYENFRNIPEYATCRYFKYIFITKKIDLPEPEKALFKESKIWYADHELLEYYAELCDKVGNYAIYNFLSEFGILPPQTDKLQVLASKSRIGKYEVYSFFAKPKELLKFSYVARRRFQKENFYQRMLDTRRIKKIQHFIDGGGVFPTNIILSHRGGDLFFQPEKSVSGHGSETGLLTVANSYSAFWIIDGQHRLYSHAGSKSDDVVSCLVFDGIEVEDERRFFLEINREQKPIQPDLIWDLEGLANGESERGIISNSVRTLNNREPFLDKIYFPLKGSKAGKIVNMAAFCNGINNASLVKEIAPNCIGTKNPLFAEDKGKMTNQVATAIQRFFRELKTDLNDRYESFVFGNAGIPIMLYVLEPVIARIGHAPKESELSKYTALISKYFESQYPTEDGLRELRESVNSEGARKNVAKDIGHFIRREQKDKSFWPKMEQSDSVADIIVMERRLAVLISTELSNITTSWERQRVPQAIYQSAKKRMELDGTRFDENFDLGDEQQIVMQRNNWEEVFSGIFIKARGFVNQEEVKLGFSYLSKIRNPASHGKSVIVNREDLDQCNIYLQKFSRVIPEIPQDFGE